MAGCSLGVASPFALEGSCPSQTRTPSRSWVKSKASTLLSWLVSPLVGRMCWPWIAMGGCIAGAKTISGSLALEGKEERWDKQIDRCQLLLKK